MDSSYTESSEEEEEELTVKPRPKKVIINVATTQYDVVKDVARSPLKWKLSFREEDENWDVCWIDTGMTPERLMKMKPYQKINHFPGMYTLARKNTLAINLNNMKKLFPEEYDFFPPTWILPHDASDFRAQFNGKRAKTFIVKPEASCQGRGIFLTRNFENINPDERYVVQRYLHRPFLIDGLKFDLRIYVLVAGCEPLRVFIHEEGLARFATEPYVSPTRSNLGEMCMHLTNYAINKNNPNFVFNDSEKADDIGHKKSLTALMRILQDLGYDTVLLWSQIEQIVLNTLCCAQPMLSQIYRACQPYDPANGMCFEILGFDVFLDHKMKPWLLEVNHSPSFTTDTPLDRNIKERVILDAISLLDISPENREKYLVQVKLQIQQRAEKGRNFHALRNERLTQQRQFLEERDRLESMHKGGFKKIFPTADSVATQRLLEGANKVWMEQTGGKPKAKKSEENKGEIKPKAKPPICKLKLEPAQEEPTPRKGRLLSSTMPKLLRQTSSVEPIKPESTKGEQSRREPHYMLQTSSNMKLKLIEDQRIKIASQASKERLALKASAPTGEFVKPKIVEFAMWERRELPASSRFQLR